MFGVILLIAAAFVAVVVMGINLSSKTDEIQKLKAELANPQKDSGSKLLDIDAMYRVVQEEGYFPTKDSDALTISRQIDLSRLSMYILWFQRERTY